MPSTLLSAIRVSDGPGSFACPTICKSGKARYVFRKDTKYKLGDIEMRTMKNLMLASVRTIARLFHVESFVEKKMEAFWRLAHREEVLKKLKKENENLVHSIKSKHDLIERLQGHLAGKVTDSHVTSRVFPKKLFESVVSAELNERLSALEPAGEMKPWSRVIFEPQRLAEIAVLRAGKTDFFLAKKLLLQADIETGCACWVSSLYDDVSAGERVLETLAEEAGSDDHRNGDPLDFLIVSSQRAGTTAVQNFLSLHPNLVVTQKSEIDTALETGRETNLARKYAAKKTQASVDVRAGIVQHGYVAGLSAGFEVAERLSKIVRRERFYHLVRNPLEALRAHYNKKLVDEFAGSYSLPGSRNYPTDGRLSLGSSLSWPARWEIPACGRPLSWNERRSGGGRGAAGAEPRLAIDDEDRELVRRQTFDEMKYWAVGDAYGRWFDEWEPIDAAEFVPRRSHEGMSRLFKAFGVDDGYRHPVFDTLAMNPVRRTMINSGIEILGLEHPIIVNLDYTGQALYSYTFPSIELARLEPNQLWLAAGFAAQPVSLVVSFEQWAWLPLNTRKRLLGEGICQFILEQVAIPAWIDCHLAWEKAMAGHLLADWKGLEEKGIASVQDIRSHVGVDIRRFLDVHPGFLKRWPGVEAIL